MRTVLNLLRNTRGVTAIEYALVASLISIAAVGAFDSLGQRVDAKFTAVNQAMADNM